jgi:peptide/nickel transport system substrate-binding protein
LNPAHFGYDLRIKPYPFDPEKAKALLKEAGYGGGLSLILNAPEGRYEKGKEIFETIADQLTKIGIKTEVKMHEYGSFMKRLYSPDGIGPMYPFNYALTFDADGILKSLLSCGAPLARYCNKQLDTLLDQGRVTLDPKKRLQIYSEALKIIHDEAPMLFLYYGYDIYGVGNRVQHYAPNPSVSGSFHMHGLGVFVKD